MYKIIKIIWAFGCICAFFGTYYMIIILRFFMLIIFVNFNLVYFFSLYFFVYFISKANYPLSDVMYIHVSIIRARIEFERKRIKPLIWRTVLKGTRAIVCRIISNSRVRIKVYRCLVFDVCCVPQTLFSHSICLPLYGAACILLPLLIKHTTISYEG